MAEHNTNEQSGSGLRPLRIEVTLPFCPNVCQYCPMPSDYETAMLMPAYCEALGREIAASGADMDDYQVTSIHLGGGIASYVKAERVCELLDQIHSSFDLSDDVEITLRALLGYVNETKLRNYHAAGVTKIDVDYHTGSEDYSRYTARLNYPEHERMTVRAFAHYGMDDVGYELLYGMPGQTADMWQTVLNEALEFEPTHIEAHPFEVPSGSRSADELDNLFRVYGDRPEFHRAQGEELDELYALTVEALGKVGMQEYLPGCFARPGHERRHLLDAAAGIDYLSFGAGGISCIDGYCSENVSDIRSYVDADGDIAKLTVRAWPCGEDLHEEADGK